jgi:hypothetical protein
VLKKAKDNALTAIFFGSAYRNFSGRYAASQNRTASATLLDFCQRSGDAEFASTSSDSSTPRGHRTRGVEVAGRACSTSCLRQMYVVCAVRNSPRMDRVMQIYARLRAQTGVAVQWPGHACAQPRQAPARCWPC